jgi:hypothetical protein
LVKNHKRIPLPSNAYKNKIIGFKITFKTENMEKLAAYGNLKRRYQETVLEDYCKEFQKLYRVCGKRNKIEEEYGIESYPIMGDPKSRRLY